MYIHVGEDTLIKTEEIIAIIDQQSFQSSPYVEEFLKVKENLLIDLSKGAFKSVVVTTKHIYYSPLASNTLRKRSQRLTL